MFIFQAIRPGLHHFSHPNAQILQPIKIGREAVLDVWFCPNKDGDGPRKYTFRRLQLIADIAQKARYFEVSN